MMSSNRLGRMAIAIGGFLIFVGVIMIGTFALGLLGVIDALESAGYRILALWALLIVGVLDLVSGVMLRRE